VNLGIALGVAGLVFAVGLVVTIIRESARTNPCFWGHEKKYVSMRDLISCGHYVHWTRSQSHLQDARWVCEKCPVMGEECIDLPGVWMVEHGKLVRDEKRWASWKDRMDIRR